MEKIIHTTKEAPAAIGPYSQAVECAGFIFCSGQIALDPKTGALIQGGVKEETEQVMKNIEAVLRNLGLNFSNVIKTTIFLADMNDFVTVNEVYGRHFPENPPARSTVAVKTLPKNVKVEIEVLAHR